MIEALSGEYIITARAKGLSAMRILWRHAFGNIAVRLVTVLALAYASLLEGAVITETVFNIPGIGRLTVDAITNRDYPIIQGVMVIFSGAYVVINLLVDLSYSLIDPRISR